MRNYHTAILVVALTVAQPFMMLGFASSTQPTSANSGDRIKQCEMIAKACIQAGYKRHGDQGKLWKDCMKPVLLNQTVSGVKLDPNDVATCRQAKIQKMQDELNMLQQVK